MNELLDQLHSFQKQPEALQLAECLRRDRELLELAAKAAGIGTTWTDTYRQFFKDGYELGQRAFWNPLTDDGDALRLAVMLRMHVSVYPTRTSVTADDVYLEQLHGVDPMGATRGAIVRAAAEIGRSLTPKE